MLSAGSGTPRGSQPARTSPSASGSWHVGQPRFNSNRRWPCGMRVGPRELVLWSFLMASAHGAGLMLVPVLAGLRGEGVSIASAHAEHLGHIGHQLPDGNASVLPALAAVGLHSCAMLAVAGLLAVVVYQKLGVEVLRRAWVNLDLIWVGALVVVGGLALGLSLWPVLAG